MPYEWHPPQDRTQRLRLWPHRSLSSRGFVWFIGLTALLIGVPLLAVIGSPVLWGLLPFVAAAVWAIWVALRKNGRDRAIVEVLSFSETEVTLVRHGPHGRRQEWRANPHWLRLTLHETGGPVPNYLTLGGAERDVELGRFLSEPERIALYRDLRARLAALQ
ncbi:DUF2244 domain-containing protein [Rhodobacter sp. Har01]|uniref:DUF2244 domain-containing protein n=1 Tax=Rhodobacter sp. Har01 TaxID=2883999 RepID=UPI001D0920EB|nr:DUF2244 domain-containing protein [Rhodobacter sp. Har01]MCB6178695.1 DUF2244 domain-containing protein [Rhodobacter sp. Har01]